MDGYVTLRRENNEVIVKAFESNDLPCAYPGCYEVSKITAQIQIKLIMSRIYTCPKRHYFDVRLMVEDM